MENLPKKQDLFKQIESKGPILTIIDNLDFIDYIKREDEIQVYNSSRIYYTKNQSMFLGSLFVTNSLSQAWLNSLFMLNIYLLEQKGESNQIENLETFFQLELLDKIEITETLKSFIKKKSKNLESIIETSDLDIENYDIKNHDGKNIIFRNINNYSQKKIIDFSYKFLELQGEYKDIRRYLKFFSNNHNQNSGNVGFFFMEDNSNEKEKDKEREYDQNIKFYGFNLKDLKK